MNIKKIISLILVCMLIIVNLTFVNAVENKQNTVVEPNAINWYTIAWNVLKLIGGNFTWDTKTPYYITGENMDQCSSGSHTFNDGENAGKLKHDVHVRNISNDELTSFVENSNPLTWTRKALIAYYNPNGVEIGNKSVTHEQYYSISPSGSGTFVVEFSTAQQHKWNCYVQYWHYDDYNGVSNISSIDGISFYKTSNKIYKVPSNTHKYNYANKQVNMNHINMDELLNQLYDNELETYVSDFKDYHIGNKLIFEDTISNIYYDDKIDATIFVFNTKDEDGKVEWPFEGNLLSKYSIGQKLLLNFEIVEDYSDDFITIEQLNYIQEGLKNLDSNTYPNIEDYL